ncbi:hypothetical protein [Streptomyces sp. NPDC060366]|uniref:hypothetical protein n=1 Tax=Streptomyces sp. NPDC060366 TaxID=3347105 RepID=UPI0036582514
MIEPLLPPAGRARGRWRGHRQILDGIVFKFRTGFPWSPVVVRRRLTRLEEAGLIVFWSPVLTTSGWGADRR